MTQAALNVEFLPTVYAQGILEITDRATLLRALKIKVWTCTGSPLSSLLHLHDVPS